jgi:L-amino acid N-acyltransferase YncA
MLTVCQANAETGTKSLEARELLSSQQSDSFNVDTPSSPLSSHQKSLLAGFGVLAANTAQHQGECQDIPPASPEPQIPKEVAPTPFRPTFNPPRSNIPFHPKQFIMALGNFDPYKYGAPARKQKSIDEKTNAQPQAEVVKAASDDSRLVAHPMPESMTQSTPSESSNIAGSFQTQSSNVSTDARRTASKVLKPKSTNYISIPGFDPSKYGKPTFKTKRALASTEEEVNTGGVVYAQGPTSSATVAGPPPSLPSERETTPVAPQYQPSKKSEEKARINQHYNQHYISNQASLNPIRGEVVSNRDSANGDNRSIQLPSSIASTTVTAPRDHQTETMSAQSYARASQMVPFSLPSALPDMSKEDRLKQLQQAKLREISLKNRTKVAPETTSLHDLKLARTPAVSETQPLALPPMVATQSAPLPAPSDQVPTIIVPMTVQSKTSRNDPGNSTHRSPAAILPPPVPGMSKEERLKQVQQASLRQIGIRNRTKGGDPETTSLADLHVARTPTTPESHGPARATNAFGLGQAMGMNSFQRAISKAETDLLASRDAQEKAALSPEPFVSEKKFRNPKWCTNEELRPIQAILETNSNGWGSDVPSNASIATNDSTRPMQLHGKLFQGPPADDRDEVEALLGWDGKMQPPPVDWNDRPRFNNNSPAFKNGFNNWFATAAPDNCEFVDRTPMFRKIPLHIFSNTEWHADGIGMIRKEYTLDAGNISKYGYDKEPADVAKYAEPVTAEDFADWGKLDLSEPDNVAFKEETTEQLVNNWRAHQERSKKTTTLAVMHGHKALKESKSSKPEVNPNRPSVNIYLRPAVKSDVRQLTKLYNWWVENSVKPAETRTIEISDMRERFDNSKSDSLPFIVAILKGKQHVPHDHYTGMKGEQIVGFALATGFTALDYVEHIAAELEIYVHHEYRRNGVGRCLFDRLMCATDRGHMERGGYPFHCDPAERHRYEVGGARNLHKLAFVARHHSRPKKDVTEEVDVTTWLKKWLVKEWDFEEEACLKQTGAKCGRFLDITYFSKFSKWLPDEGRVPDPEPKHHKHAPLPG